MGWEDFMLLTNRKPKAVLSSTKAIFKQTGRDIAKKMLHKDILHEYGRFLKLDRMILKDVQMMLQNGDTLPYFQIPNTFKIAQTEKQYLSKIISLCKKHNTKLYLVGTPKRFEILNYPKYGVGKFETFYKSNYSDVEFLDFSKMTMPDNYYGDFVHLNFRGSAYFSEFLQNHLSDILETSNSLKNKTHSDTFNVYSSDDVQCNLIGKHYVFTGKSQN
jgi:hypothetical protein